MIVVSNRPFYAVCYLEVLPKLKEIKMADRALTLEELEGRPLAEILQDVADQQSTMIVLLPDGREVIIEPKPCLKPLPALEGHVPEGWKDAIYARD